MTCSFVAEGSPYSPVESCSGVIPLLACTRDLTDHLVSLGVSGKRGKDARSDLREKDLILNRAGICPQTDEETKTMTVCPKHRKGLTVAWAGRQRTKCCYPTHQGQRVTMKLLRRINQTLSAEIFTLHHVVIPIGSG